MRHCFISHSHSDAEFAEMVSDKIKLANLLPWHDIELRPGDAWRHEIDRAISESLAVVVVMTPAAKQSEYVAYEWAYALGAGILVIPLLLNLEAKDVHPRLKELQYMNFTTRPKPWERLIKVLQDAAERFRPTSIRTPRNLPQAVKDMITALDSRDKQERARALTDLAGWENPAVRELLAEAVQHPLSDVRCLAALHLADHKDERALPGLLENCGLGWGGAKLVAGFGRAALPGLLEILHHQHYQFRQYALFCLSELGDPETVPPIVAALQDTEKGVREAAVRALDKMPGSPALPGLVEALFDERNADNMNSIRQRIISILAATKDKAVVPALARVLNDKDEPVRQAAEEALRSWGTPEAKAALEEWEHANGLEPHSEVPAGAPKVEF